MTKTKTNLIPRTRLDYSTKLKKLEEEKQQLILQRKEEIFTIIDKIGCLSIDNELLAGSFMLLKEIEDKKNNLSDKLKSFETLIREKSPIFFRQKTKPRLSKTEPDIKSAQETN
jgi:hypothetical protein